MVEPEDLLYFIESTTFTHQWAGLGLDVERDLLALQFLVMAAPQRHPVVAGTGGMHKLRFAPPGWKVGKRGALRVCYAYFEDFGIVFLITVYDKTAQDDLTAAEKRAIRSLLVEIERLLRESRRTS